MSRPSGHRKSQSTSALAVIASGQEKKRGQSSRSKLPGIEEAGQAVSSKVVDNDNALRRDSIEIGKSARRLSSKREIVRDETDDFGYDDLEKRCRMCLNLALSLKSDHSKRLGAIRELSNIVQSICQLPAPNKSLPLLVACNLHASLLLLLIRHFEPTRTISSNLTSSSADSMKELCLELNGIFKLLQGLTLLSGSCKQSCGEIWILEILIDLLLLLRHQHTSEGEPLSEQNQPTNYYILDLLFCILVDSPENARRFESLSGLEAVTRVLKGTSVSKEVRMKCIEFLYFYLLPEHRSSQTIPSSSSSSGASRSTSGGSTTSTTSIVSNDSIPYPPSPPTEVISSSPFQAPPSPHSTSSSNRIKNDLDVSFTPQTPKKRSTPNLGYLTPSNRRVSVGVKATPSLATVPASPVRYSEDNEVDEEINRMERSRAGQPRTSGLGIGLTPRPSPRPEIERSETAIHLPSLSTQSQQLTPSSHHHRHPHQQHQHRTSTPSRPISVSPIPSSPSFSRTPISHTPPSSRGMVKSSTQPGLNILSSSKNRLSSRQRSSKGPESNIVESPTELSTYPSQSRQSSISDKEETEGGVREGLGGIKKSRDPKIRHSMTSARLSISTAPTPPTLTPNDPLSKNSSGSFGPPSTKSPKIRHSRTSSQFVIPDSSEGIPPVPPSPLVSRMGHSKTTSQLSSLTEQPTQPTHSRQASSINLLHTRTPSQITDQLSCGSGCGTGTEGGMNNMERTPSKSKKAFPADLMRNGQTPSSSPRMTMLPPLGPSKRIPSGKSSDQPKEKRLLPKSATSTDLSSYNRRGNVFDKPKQKERDEMAVKGEKEERGRGEIKTVEEKKELLGNWIGNVDALVKGVENVGWFDKR